MAVLSDVDITIELLNGKNIRIHPIKISNIKGSTYNLTASKYAWALNTKNEIVLIENDKWIIKIPPNDSAVIMTEEVIWVSNKVCGTYHSKVSIVSKGGGHIGTTLDSDWIGHSAITVHNHSKTKPLQIEVGDTFVSIMFHYLNKKSIVQQDNSSSQIDFLNSLFPGRIESRYFDEGWKKQSDRLLLKMKQAPVSESDYINLKKEHRRWISKKILVYILVVLVPVIFSIIGLTTQEKETLLYKISEWMFVVGLAIFLAPLMNVIGKKLEEE